MQWEKSVLTSFVSDSGDWGFSEFGQTRFDCYSSLAITG